MKNEEHFAVEDIAIGDKSSIIDIDIDIHDLMLCCRRKSIVECSEILKSQETLNVLAISLKILEATAKKGALAVWNIGRGLDIAVLRPPCLG